MELNAKTLASTIIGTIIMIAIFSAVLVPVVSDADEVRLSEQNENYFHKLSPVSHVELSTGSKYMVNGEEVTYTNSSGNAASIVLIVSDKSVIITYGAQWFYYFIDSEGNYHSFVNSNANDVTAVLTPNGMTVTKGANTYQCNYSWCYVPDNNGSLIYVNTTSTPNTLINQGATVVAVDAGATNNGIFRGTVDNLVCTYHATNGAIDTASATKVLTFDTVPQDNTELYTVTTAQTSLVVPLTYTYEVDQDSALYNIITIIPLLVLVGLVLGVVGAFIGRD